MNIVFWYFQHGDRQIDIRHYVIALSTVHRPSESMKTLKLAFKVSTITSDPADTKIWSLCDNGLHCFQIYGSEESGEVQEEDLAAILEIMLGVKEVELSGLFLSLDNPDTEKITYGKTV